METRDALDVFDYRVPAGFGEEMRLRVMAGLRWIALLIVCGSRAFAQEAALPDVNALMREVEAHEKASEALVRNYTYNSTFTEVKLDSRGDTKKTESTEAEVFYIDQVRLERVVKRNGKDLNEEEKRKEAERIDKEIAKARKKGEEKDRDAVTFARFLELGSFSNERRVDLKGRPTIALDYTGDPKAKTRNALENAIHEMAGTVWVDEEDRAMSRVEGRFVNSFTIGAGLMVNVAKGTSFEAESTKVNGEVWLPASFTAQGTARFALLFSFSGRVSGTTTNYRRFKTNSTILPGVQEVSPE